MVLRTNADLSVRARNHQVRVYVDDKYSLRGLRSKHNAIKRFNSNI